MDKFHTTYDPITKTWSGRPLPSIFHPNANVGQILLNSLECRPNQIGQISFNNGLEMTNRELQISTIRVAQNLAKLGIGNGDVVAIAADNHHHLASVVFALLALAAPINTLEPAFKAAEFVHMLRITKPKLVISDVKSINNIREALTELGLNVPVFIFDQSQDGARSVDELLVPTGVEEDFVPTALIDGHSQTALIVCSSGTTGLSKGVKISHAIMLNQIYRNFEPTSDDVFGTFGSLYWVSGIKSLIAPTLNGAKRIITTQPFSAELLLQIITEHRVTAMLVSPFQMRQLLECPSMHETDVSCVERLYVGGAPVPEILRLQVHQLMPKCKMFVVYGLSEVAGMITLRRSQTVSKSVGKLAHGVRMRVVNEIGQLCGPNEDGELFISTEIPIQGYMNNDAATKALLDPSGWIRSGDIGRFDDDSLLYIVDRKIDFIHTNVARVSPSDVENIVLGAKGVSAVCVVGLPVSGVYQLPAALVIRKKDEPVATEAEINELLKERLGDHNQLRGGVYYVDELPKTYSGKVMRRVAINIAMTFYHERNAI